MTIATRHQLAVFGREGKRPRLRDRDRLFLDCDKENLERLENGAGDRSARNRDLMAAQAIQTVLVKPVAAERTRRPRASLEIRNLVRTMATANPLWGAPRVHGELLKLGFEIRTVRRGGKAGWGGGFGAARTCIGV